MRIFSASPTAASFHDAVSESSAESRLAPENTAAMQGSSAAEALQSALRSEVLTALGLPPSFGELVYKNPCEALRLLGRQWTPAGKDSIPQLSPSLDSAILERADTLGLRKELDALAEQAERMRMTAEQFAFALVSSRL